MNKFDIKSALGGIMGKGKSEKGLYADSGGYRDDFNGQAQSGDNGGAYDPGYDNYPPRQQDGYNNSYPVQRQDPGGYPMNGNYANGQNSGYNNGYDGGNYGGNYNGNYDGNYGGNYGGYNNGYGSYPPRQQNEGYGGHPEQRDNGAYGGGYGYTGQQSGYSGQQYGYSDSMDEPAPPAAGRKKAGSSAPKKSLDIGGLVSNITGGVKSSIGKLGARAASRKKTYSDEDIVPDVGSRTADLSDIQASELGVAPASPSAVLQDDFDDAFLDDGFDTPSPSYPAASARTGAAADDPGRFRSIAEQAAAAALGGGGQPGPAAPDGSTRAAGRTRTAYDREAAISREAAMTREAESERVNYKFTPDVVYDQHRDEIGFVPPSSAAPHNHLRYKRRNRRPMKMWLKTSLTALCCALFFAAVISLFFINMMTSRVNYVGKSVHNTVYLTVDEKRALAQEETSIEENENEFTVPTITEKTDKDVKLILLIASDEAFASGKSSNCDSFLLVAIDNRYKQIKLISIMSELYARIPGYYSNRLGKAFYYDTAKGDYSLSILRQTIYDNFRLSIDNYVVVDYKALETLVNRVGGVPMELSVQEAEYMRKDPKYGLFPRYTYGGHYNMSGAETLNYVRMRKVGDGAFDRTLRQRKVFYELVSKLGDLSFIQLSELTYAMLPLLGTDMSKSEVLYYFRNARDISGYQIDQLRIPIEGSFRFGEADVLGNKIEVLVTNYAFTSEALRDYIYDNDSTYQGGAYAEDVVLPDVAPLPEMLEEQEGQ